MDEWKYSGRADQVRDAEQDDALKAAEVEGRPTTEERPLTPEMKRLVRGSRRSTVLLLAITAIFALAALVCLVLPIPGKDRIQLALSFGGIAVAVALLGFAIRWLLQSDSRRGTYTVEEGRIGTRIQLHENKMGSDRMYMMNVGSHERAVSKAAYEAARTITRGTVVSLSGLLEIRDKDGALVWHRNGYTPEDAPSA